jgi:6-phosphogluconolactonase
MDFFVGTYTRMGGPGIAFCSLDAGKLALRYTEELPNPTYVILNAKQDRLYAVSSDSASGAPGGSAAAYAIKADGLQLLSRRDTLGEAPCHPCLSADERFLYTANYVSGNVTVFPVDEDGGIGQQVQVVQHEGNGPRADRQTGPHAHQVTFIPGTNLLCAIDLGIDAVMVYEQDPKTGLLTFHDRLDVEPGLGPRHLTYGPDGVAFLLHELGNQVSVIVRDGGKWTTRQTISMLPEGYDLKNTAAAVRLSADGKQLFASNRGHDSIAVYDVAADYTLALVGIYPTGGGGPRDFILLDDGALLIAHQDGDVRLASFDPAKGIQTLDVLSMPGAVCVCPVV